MKREMNREEVTLLFSHAAGRILVGLLDAAQEENDPVAVLEVIYVKDKVVKRYNQLPRALIKKTNELKKPFRLVVG